MTITSIVAWMYGDWALRRSKSSMCVLLGGSINTLKLRIWTRFIFCKNMRTVSWNAVVETGSSYKKLMELQAEKLAERFSRSQQF
jgi:hypothetical protein